MNSELLYWSYLINAVLLITHEIDSAYWQEWKLFGLREKFGKNLFVIVHIPLIFVVLVGLNLVWIPHIAGLIISISMAVCGLFAFFFHLYYLNKKREELIIGCPGCFWALFYSFR